jgi:hypothetical protein
LPAADFGPVLASALTRFARCWRSLVIVSMR